MSSKVVYLSSGVTEAKIQASISALGDGDKLIFPKDDTIRINSGLVVDVSHRSVTIDLNGSTLQQAGDTAVVSVTGHHPDGKSARLDESSDGKTTITFSGAQKVSVGDFIKVYSDDKLPNDQGKATRLGQALEVVSVKGSTLTLGGELHYAESYHTNVRASEYESGTAVVKNGIVRGDQSNPDWIKTLVSVRSTVGTQIDHLTVRDGNSMGINFADTVNGRVTQSAAINLKDDTANGHYGYGVHSGGSLNTTVDGFYAERVRHATDDNAVGLTGTHVDPSKYGGDFSMAVSNVIANNTSAFAFSWHSEGRFNKISDSLVFDSHGVLGARGLANSFTNVSGAGNDRGIVFYEYGDGDGRGIKVSDVSLKEHSLYPYFNQNEPWGNSISDSSFEILSSKVRILPNDPSTTLTNVALKVGAFATDESITGSGGADQILGGKGIDTVDAKGGNDYIWGGRGSDVLTGNSGIDRFAYHTQAEAGDTIKDFGTGKNGDVIDVSVMFYQFGWSSLDGHVRFVQSGSDTLLQVDVNGGGNSYLTLATLMDVEASSITSANISTDILVSGAAGSTNGEGPVLSVPDAPGKVPLVFSEFADLAYQQGSDDPDVLLGADRADLLVGAAGSDLIVGRAGDDVLAGGSGADTLRGGSGRDVAAYKDAGGSVVASLEKPGSNTGHAAGDVYSQIENLIGSDFSDRLSGNNSVNHLFGGGGSDVLYGLGGTDVMDGGSGADRLEGGTKNDTLRGGNGGDLLIGGIGYDRLSGGSGGDRFILDAPGRGVDSIIDFQAGSDKIGLSGAFELDLLTEIHFISGYRPEATTARATMLYNKASGALWWDADGEYGHDPIEIARFQNIPDLELRDFFLF